MLFRTQQNQAKEKRNSPEILVHVSFKRNSILSLMKYGAPSTKTGQALPNRNYSDSRNGSIKLNTCFPFKYISLHCQLPVAGSCMRQVCASLQGNSTHPEFIPNLTLEETVHYQVSPKVIKVANLPIEL